MKPTSIKTTALLISSFLAIPGAAFASHHFESNLVIKDPTLNQLDNYVFKSTQADATAFIMNVNSSPKSVTGGIFKPGALYNIHVAADDDFKTGHTFSFKFDGNGQFTVYDLRSANAAPGTEGKEITKGELGKTVSLKDGIKLWAGVAKDPFFGNSPGLHVFRKQLAEGTYDPNVWKSTKGKNIFEGRRCASIVIEVPNSLLGKKIKVFMTTAVQNGTKWQQVQYSANPLFSHAMLFENEALKEEHDRSRPDTDLNIKDIVSARVARASAVAGSQKNPIAYGDKVASMLVPDVITYTTGTQAKFSAQERNGRALSDDAMSAMLTLLIGQPTDQAVTNQKLYTTSFPYIMPATLK